jgi:hypothetical protein
MRKNAMIGPPWRGRDNLARGIYDARPQPAKLRVPRPRTLRLLSRRPQTTRLLRLLTSSVEQGCPSQDRERAALARGALSASHIALRWNCRRHGLFAPRVVFGARRAEPHLPIVADAAAGPAGFFIGLALAGFFDGILLHQILQWHSLFSSLDGQVYQDLRFRMLTDGAFHAAMYGIGLVGLWLLWRGRYEFASDGSGKRFASAFAARIRRLASDRCRPEPLAPGSASHQGGQPKLAVVDLAFFALGLVCAGLGMTLCPIWRQPPAPPEQHGSVERRDHRFRGGRRRCLTLVKSATGDGRIPAGHQPGRGSRRRG